jgi:hypothetical protein
MKYPFTLALNMMSLYQAQNGEEKNQNNNFTNISLFQNVVIMALGLIGLSISVGYMAYMRTKYEKMGLYSAVDDSGQQVLRQRTSRWS